MVHYASPSPLDATFGALADTTRRSMIARLADAGELPVSALGAGFGMSLPAVLKHVGVLSDAGLVRREKRGRTVFVSLQGERLAAARSWLDRYERFWSERLDALARYVETPPCPSQPSSSSDASQPPSTGSSGPGPSRKG